MTCGRPSVSQSKAVMGNESQAENAGPTRKCTVPTQAHSSDMNISILLAQLQETHMHGLRLMPITYRMSLNVNKGSGTFLTVFHL